MSTSTVFEAASRVGLRIDLDGADLVLEAATPPPADVLDLIARFKRDIVAELRRRKRTTAWHAEDWQAFFDERASVLEFDAGLPRPEAEVHAVAECVEEWIHRHLPSPAPDECLHCEGHEPDDTTVVHFAVRGSTAWLHAGCWPVWRAAREAEAREALAKFGIISQQREDAE